MPTVEYSLTDLFSLLGRELSEQELREDAPMIGVSVESIEGDVLTVEVFPDRPDMLSIEGFARALKGFLGIESGLVEYRVEPSGLTLEVDPSVKEVRPCISAAVVRDIELDDSWLKSLMDIQEKLHITHGLNRTKVAIGVHDLDQINPPFKYKAVKPEEIRFIPLDMTEELNLQEILERHPKGRDYAFTLEGKKKYPIILDRDGNVLSFPPIINGELTRLTESTRNLFIELTGTSQLAVDQALNIIASSVADRGGRIQSVEVKE